MQSAVLTDLNTIEMRDQERPIPAEHEVLVRIREVGLCGSDVHYWEHGRIGDFVVEEPLILGHESAGEVVALGDAVTDVSIGDRVAIEPGIACKQCHRCRSGQYHLCPDMRFMATPPIDGAFRDFVAWDANFVHRLPPSVSTKAGALCEPLSVALHACDLGDISPGDAVLISGAGPIGLITLEVARASGASPIVISDIVPSKLRRARERGAIETIDVRHESITEISTSVTDGSGFDVVIEASGAPRAYESVLPVVTNGGTMVCLGLPNDSRIPLDVVDLATREISLQGSFRFVNTYQDAISLLAEQRVDVTGLIDDTFELTDITAAFERTREPDVVKVMVSLA